MFFLGAMGFGIQWTLAFNVRHAQFDASLHRGIDWPSNGGGYCGCLTMSGRLLTGINRAQFGLINECG